MHRATRYSRLHAIALACGLAFSCLAAFAATTNVTPPFPDWTYHMKVWPFDVLYPTTSESTTRANLDAAVNNGANTVLVYIEEEQMYGSFVDGTGFSNMLAKIGYLVSQAHDRNLKVVCYLNALEVMTRNARHNPGVPSLSRVHPDWIQRDIRGRPVVWTGIRNEWITRDMEDAWASPYSGFRALFKQRLEALGEKGLDAVYLDQASLPGMQDHGKVWASRDPGFVAAFHAQYGLSVPVRASWRSPAWRTFVYFRHQAVQEYLGDLARTARTNGITPFFESSANDTRDGTLLGNEPALTVLGDIAYSPEIEAGRDYFAAYRMAKFARDIRQDLPMLFLGWPGNLEDARRQFAIAMCESGNYYPTADAPVPPEAFQFVDSVCTQIMAVRVPYHSVALLYSVRNKDWSFRSRSTFRAYRRAFAMLAERHLPFRILALETMSAHDLDNIGTVVLPRIESLSDAEAALLDGCAVVLAGRKNGSRDAEYVKRSSPVVFSNVIDIDSVSPGLPFAVDAPAHTWIEYYQDGGDPSHMFLFCFSRKAKGAVTVSAGVTMTVTVHVPGMSPRNITATRVTVPVRGYLEVLDLHL